MLWMILSTMAFASPTATTVTKNGSCPSGYISSGNYCKPNSGARFAIEKNGSCPSGYSSSGDIAWRTLVLPQPQSGSCPSDTAVRGTIVWPKPAYICSDAYNGHIGSCPSGYSSSSSYTNPILARFAIERMVHVRLDTAVREEYLRRTGARLRYTKMVHVHLGTAVPAIIV